MARSANIQNAYLNELRKNKLKVTVFLTNGFQLRGKIEAFDNFTVLLRSDGQQQLIYKHAISTFVPEQNISISET